MAEARAGRVPTLRILTPPRHHGATAGPLLPCSILIYPSASMDINDINNAHSFAEDAAANLEDLQTTEFWLHLDEDIRIGLCKAHAMCRSMANAIEVLMPTAAADSID